MPEPVHEIVAATSKFELRRMTFREELGRPFEFEVEAFAKVKDSSESAHTGLADLPADKFLGSPICVTIRRDNTTRYFNGLVCRFLNVGRFGNYQAYHFVARPWLWFLSRTADCKIYQDISVPDIIKQVFNDNGFSEHKFSLQGSYPKREYCAQYRESDFAFVSRLMEHEGIYYYFEHENSKHVLTLVDDNAASKPIEGTNGGKLVYRPPGEAQVGVEHISRWRRAYEIQTGAVVLDDFDFTKPSAKLEGRSVQKHKHKHAALEVFEYPGEYTEARQGKTYAKTRLQELQAKHSQVEAVGDAQGLAAGRKFKLAEFPRKVENNEYLVVAAVIEIESGELEQFGTAENRFEATVTAVDAKTQFRPTRTTPRPRAHGPQTAMVVGKSGEDIWTDKHGRVKVQFHWDRYGKKDENSSCWLRVSQVWAGANWGAIHIPRIGQEVIVEFLDGDLDRPIITGRVYNADQMPPYALPANQTKSGMLSRTTKEGNAKLANELRFDDKKDEEEIYFHAERDFNRVVENNDTLKVGLGHKDKGDQTIEIQNNQTVTIGNSESDDGSQTITVWKDRTETVKNGNETVTIEKGKRTVNVDTGADTHNVKTGNRTVNVDQGNDTHAIKKGNRNVTIDMGNDSLTIKMGNQTTKLKIGKSTLDAMQGIELKCGPSSIKLDPSGITIQGMKVQIKGQVMTQIDGAITQVNGSGMVMVKGGVVMIN